MKPSNRRSVQFCSIMFAALLASVCPLKSVWADPVASVEEAQGQVMMHSAGAAADAWQPVTQSTPVSNGDSLKTENGSCVLVYSDQARFKLDAGTSVTVQDKDETRDLVLDLGRVSASINKDKVIKPFQVVTPTAVGAVRGTDVVFDFNDEGQMTIDLQDGGPVQVFNDDNEMTVELAGKKKIIIKYDAETGILTIQNDCGSDGVVTFSVQGTEYAENPCDKKEINLGTAAGPNGNPDPPGNTPEPPDTHDDDNPPPPSSPTGETETQTTGD